MEDWIKPVFKLMTPNNDTNVVSMYIKKLLILQFFFLVHIFKIYIISTNEMI